MAPLPSVWVNAPTQAPTPESPRRSLRAWEAPHRGEGGRARPRRPGGRHRRRTSPGQRPDATACCAPTSATRRPAGPLAGEVTVRLTQRANPIAANARAGSACAWRCRSQRRKAASRAVCLPATPRSPRNSVARDPDRSARATRPRRWRDRGQTPVSRSHRAAVRSTRRAGRAMTDVSFRGWVATTCGGGWRAAALGPEGPMRP